MKSLFRSILWIGAMIGLAHIAWAQDTQPPAPSPDQTQSTDASDRLAIADTWKALRGLKGVYVLVEALQDNVKDTGLTRETLQTTVELELRRVGIHVYDRDDPKQYQEIIAKNIPHLYLNVNTVKGTDLLDNLYAYNVELSLEEDVLCLRSNNSKSADADQLLGILGATVWHQIVTGLCGEARLSDAVQEAAKQLTDQFCNDFLKANPKTK
ncbi:MAG TPA: hypothetical protein VKV18_08480 [Chthonomonas sp.]|uniref:hypothetical protein n=1 Tax=Chthonomonas sp. TaxID=2282153 RepID=UPI002B4AF114|nr:hypothetical protein [Chthonomonas sp.]HLI48706.1 hypothetical protein [Chthonomonas sp.]